MPFLAALRALVSPKALIFVAGAVVIVTVFQVGRTYEARSHSTEITAAVEAALKEERRVTQDVALRTKDREERKDEFTDERQDQASRDWGSIPIPAPERERMRGALEGL